MRRLLAFLVAASLATACEKQNFSSGVVLQIELPAGAAAGTVPRPEYLELDWYDASRGLFKARRVPESGRIADDGRPYVAKIVIALDDPLLKAFGGKQDSVTRRAVVRASIPGGRWIIGRRRFEARLGYIVPIETVVLTDAELLTIDDDADRVPNDVDVCPGTDDFIGCTGEDGGARDGGRDAAAVDASSDAPAPARTDGGAVDAGLDGGTDGRTTPAELPPEPPKDLKATSVKATEVQLAWTETAKDVSSFVVERIMAGTFQRVGDAPASKPAFTDSGLAPATAYTYQVRALRGQLQSAPSEPVSVTTTR